MSVSLSQALRGVNSHRDVVPLYFVQSAGVLIVTGVAGTHGGAIILDDALQFVRSCSSKSAALSAIRNN